MNGVGPASVAHQHAGPKSFAKRLTGALAEHRLCKFLVDDLGEGEARQVKASLSVRRLENLLGEVAIERIR